MAAFQPAPDARSRPGNAAGLGAVVLGMLVAIAVAALFLVLIGASRGGRLGPPEHYRAIANHGQTRNQAISCPWPAAPVLVIPRGTTGQPSSCPALAGFAFTTTSPTPGDRDLTLGAIR
jgi:hypothetical protein